MKRIAARILACKIVSLAYEYDTLAVIVVNVNVKNMHFYRLREM